MRKLIWIAVGVAMVVVAGAAALFIFEMPPAEEEAPFGYKALVEYEGKAPSVCGLDYLGRTHDKALAYKVSVSTRVIEEQYVVSVMQVSALRITDPETMTGDMAMIEEASVRVGEINTDNMTRPSGEEVDDYIAVATNPGELAALPIDMLQGSEFHLRLTEEPDVHERELPRVGDDVADQVVECFKAMKVHMESDPVPKDEPKEE